MTLSPMKMRRRSFLSSALVRKGYPNSFAFRLVIASDRFKTTEARKAEAPEATIDFKRSTSLSDQDLINGTVASLIRSQICCTSMRQGPQLVRPWPVFPAGMPWTVISVVTPRPIIAVITPLFITPPPVIAILTRCGHIVALCKNCAATIAELWSVSP